MGCCGGGGLGGEGTLARSSPGMFRLPRALECKLRLSEGKENMTNGRQLPTLAIATISLIPFLLTSCAVGPTADPPSVPPSGPASPGMPPATTASSADTPLSALSTEATCDNWRRPEFFASASPARVWECIEAGAPLHDPLLPAIFHAARSATDPAVIRLLTDAGADPNVRMASGWERSGWERSYGYTPLHTAAASNPVPGVIEALVVTGADVHARNRDEETPLHSAWANPNPAVVQALLRSGADPLARDQTGRVADPTACANWNTLAFVKLALPSRFDLCLAQGEGLRARDGRGDTPLHLAARSEVLSVVALLLGVGADPNERNHAGATPLHAAFYNKGAGVVTALLEAGAEVNAGAGGYGTPLLHAVAKGRRITFRDSISANPVNALLEAGADVNAADSLGTTPLLGAMGPGRRAGSVTDLPRRLLALGADPNARDNQGRTPLHQAAALAEGPDVIGALLNAGADPQALANDGASPLHAATASASTEVIELLLQAGVDPTGHDKGGRTPLHLAVGTSRSNGLWYATHFSEPGFQPPWLPRVLALLDAGADPDARDADGNTPLHLSLWTRDSTLVSVLAQAGADVNARNGRGETPLHIARSQTGVATVRKLLELGANPEARDDAGRIADPVCYWDPEFSGTYAWDFLAAAPAESVQGCLESGVSVGETGGQGATLLARLLSTAGSSYDVRNVLSVLVAAGADVTATDEAGRAPLHPGFGRRFGWAPPSISADMTLALLDTGADPTARDSLGSTPLHFAPASTVPHLVAAGADLNARNNGGQTPLHIALSRDDLPKVRSLLQHGADTAAVDSAGNSANPIACERWGAGTFFALADAELVAECLPPNVDAPPELDAPYYGAWGLSLADRALPAAAASARDTTVIRLLLEAGADVQLPRDFPGDIPLHHAARSGTPGAVQMLIEAGADVNGRNTFLYTYSATSLTPLHFAAASNPNPEVVSTLLEMGAELHAPDHEGKFPLHYAAMNSNPAVAAALLEAGADVNAPRGGFTPLHQAALSNSNPAVVTLLIATGADVNARDGLGFTPLHAAARYNPHPEIITTLLAAGAEVNARAPAGGIGPEGGRASDLTPLFEAVFRPALWSHYSGPWPTRGNVQVIEALLRAGADLEQPDRTGRTPLHAAAQTHPAVYPLLLRLGADPNVRDANGRTPIDYALENRSLDGLPEVRRIRESWRRPPGP